jgi:hypothetical protein
MEKVLAIDAVETFKPEELPNPLSGQAEKVDTTIYQKDKEEKQRLKDLKKLYKQSLK